MKCLIIVKIDFDIVFMSSIILKLTSDKNNPTRVDTPYNQAKNQPTNQLTGLLQKSIYLPPRLNVLLIFILR